MRPTAALLTLLAAITPLPLAASEQNPVGAALEAPSRFVPGQSLTVSLKLMHDKGWHTYHKDPGDAGLPTAITWRLPQGVSAGPILWPKPKKFEDGSGLVGYGYTGTILLPTEIKVPASYTGALPIRAKAAWLMCKDVCIPGEAQLALEISMAPGGAAGAGDGRPQGAPLQDDGPSLVWILVLAFAGGLILNLMPCVLPVLSLKVLDFVRQAGDSRAHTLKLSGAFTAGVLASFWVLAGVVAGLKSGGQAVGWGFQFQSPVFVAFMAALVLGVTLNLFGVFELILPGKVADKAYGAGLRGGMDGAFFQGVFMTLLSTPCTAPFLGTALGFAFGAGTVVLFLVFTSVGLGLALPFVLISAFPRLKSWLPKPGAWMLRFKQFMGFPMLATLVWLLWVLDRQAGPDALALTLAWLVLLSYGCWTYGIRHSRAAGALMVSLWLLGGWWLASGPLQNVEDAHHIPMPKGWVAYNASDLEKLRGEGRTVFLDFTADWCWTCKVNEKVALEDKSVLRKFEELNVVKMRADWTKRDAEITGLIRGFGKSGVPLYVLYKGSAQPQLLSEVILPTDVLRALN